MNAFHRYYFLPAASYLTILVIATFVRSTYHFCLTAYDTWQHHVRDKLKFVPTIIRSISIISIYIWKYYGFYHHFCLNDDDYIRQRVHVKIWINRYARHKKDWRSYRTLFLSSFLSMIMTTYVTRRFTIRDKICECTQRT